MFDSVDSNFSVTQTSPLPQSAQSERATLGEVLKLLQYDGHCTARTDVPQFRRRRVNAGQSLFATGQEFGGLYVVRFGAFKTVLTQADGRENVIAFSLQGDLLGAESACNPRYQSETTALTECEVIRLPVNEYFLHGRASDGVERMLYWAISREVVRHQCCLGIMHAEKSEVRVTRFLVALSEHLAAQGLSPEQLRLPMKRGDIANYLNITLGTVSRALSALSRLKIIDVCNRDIVIKNMQALMHFEG